MVRKKYLPGSMYAPGKPKRKLLHLLSLERFYMQKELAKMLNIKDSVVHEHLIRMEKDGLIKSERHSSKTGFLTPKGRALLKQVTSYDSCGTVTETEIQTELTPSEQMDRAHNMKFRADWDAPQDVRLKLEGTCKVDTTFLKGGYRRLSLIMEKAAFQFYPKSVLIHLRNFYAPVSEAGHVGLELLQAAVDDLVRLYPGLKIGNPIGVIEQVSGHHALERDAFATITRNSGVSLNNFPNSKGEPTLSVDSSGRDELEAVHRKKSLEQIEAYAKQVTDVMDGVRDIPKVADTLATLKAIERIGLGVQGVFDEVKFDRQIIMPALERLTALVEGRRFEATSQWT